MSVKRGGDVLIFPPYLLWTGPGVFFLITMSATHASEFPPITELENQNMNQKRGKNNARTKKETGGNNEEVKNGRFNRSG